MEHCHTFIHDLLKQLGPSNAMDPILQQEINNFPPEAKVTSLIRLLQLVNKNYIFRMYFKSAEDTGTLFYNAKI